MSDFGKLVAGFRIFKSTAYEEQKDLIKHLVRQGVKAQTLVITCSDLRIAPGKIFSSSPGDLYVVRNVAGLVPPYQDQGTNGITAAIEYGVCNLEIENIVILGHARCDAIKLLMSDQGGENSVGSWLSIAEEAKDIVRKDLENSPAEEQESACEQESILVSIKNLLSYPWVENRLAQDKLKIYGMHFNIENGELLSFDPQTRYFESVE